MTVHRTYVAARTILAKADLIARAQNMVAIAERIKRSAEK